MTTLEKLQERLSRLPELEREAMAAHLLDELELLSNPAQRKNSRPDRETLADAAAQYWQGGDGLEYQLRIRAEWDERSGIES